MLNLLWRSLQVRSHFNIRRYYSSISIEEATARISHGCSVDETGVLSELKQMFGQSSCQQQHPPRVAGGWVRDKILFRNTSDLDIVLPNDTLDEAVQIFSQSSNSLQPLYRRARNPLMSKHVDVAGFRFPSRLLVEMTEVHTAQDLLTEDLTSAERDILSSHDAYRIDAHLRDFTINSLYFNLTTNQVEDLTGSGLDDLAHKQVRTPLSPRLTLAVDPLRALRALRFAVVLEFAIDHDLWGALSDVSLHQDILQRVALQRIGTEIRKGFESSHPLRFAEMLAYSKLYRAAYPSRGCTSDRVEEGLQAIRLATAILSPESAPWYQLFAAFLVPQLEIGNSASTDAFLQSLPDWGYGKETMKTLRRFASLRSTFPHQPFETDAQIRLIDWLLSLGREYWKIGVCIVCAQSDRKYLEPEKIILHVEQNLAQFFETSPSLTGEQLQVEFPALKTHPELINPILRELLLFEIHFRLMSQEIPNELRDDFITSLIAEPFMLEQPH